MASYNVDFKPSVNKDFRRLPKSVVERVMKRIEKLNDEPFRTALKNWKALSAYIGLLWVTSASYTKWTPKRSKS